jgi:hypothetical protein
MVLIRSKESVILEVKRPYLEHDCAIPPEILDVIKEIDALLRSST